MDTITLVENQIADGERLISRLRQNRIPVRAAAWVKPTDEDRWSLYLATPLVEENGPAGAYREVYRVLRALGSLWITDSDIKLLGDKHPMTVELLELLQRYPGRTPTRSRRASLGGLAVEELYIYPPVPGEGAASREQRRLKKDVEQVTRPEDALLTEEERAIRSQLVSSGVSPEEAEKWIRLKRPQPPTPIRPKIPAGTVVKAWVAAHWGDKPEEDPNPLLMVEAPDGAHGLVLQNDTEPV